jgi:hypothetical protein
VLADRDHRSGRHAERLADADGPAVDRDGQLAEVLDAERVLEDAQAELLSRERWADEGACWREFTGSPLSKPDTWRGIFIRLAVAAEDCASIFVIREEGDLSDAAGLLCAPDKDERWGDAVDRSADGEVVFGRGGGCVAGSEHGTARRTLCRVSQESRSAGKGVRSASRGARSASRVARPASKAVRSAGDSLCESDKGFVVGGRAVCSRRWAICSRC